ncbi:Extracellular solute-binding protein, family 3 [Cynara cardunculus var. scolymus]|uniref:Extracellular solute-binding protein, family 3 n=1 Tax=Cynara cardunculus var. scolymus TaxID=59895 RepID=A0A118JV41_CYNCS|nr:Extracellular solute-binding protein, family 3 [Cynara cardunculus var. scolymus]
MAKGYHSVYWTEGSGFSETVDDDINGATAYTHSMDNVGQALWPVQPWYARRQHRNLAESSWNRMRVGVPAQSLSKQFVNVEFDPEKNQTVIGGFVIAVFDEMMKQMNLPYDYFPFYVINYLFSFQKFDVIAGDVTILSSRHEYADFTQPYTESGLEMIVPIRSRLSNQPWLFMKPFTSKMWWLIAAITLYNGFIIWLIERTHCDHLQGSIMTQIGIIIWLAFTTLFTFRESGKLKELKDAFLISEKCVDNKSFPNEDESLSPRNFSILFESTVGASTLALAIYIIIGIR